MKLRRKITLAAAICGACFFWVRACQPVPASAAVDYVTLTPAQTRALFGDSLSITYFDGTDWQTGTLNYLTSAAEIAEAPNFGNMGADRDLFYALAPEDTRYIVYSSSDLNIQSNSQYQINLEPQINFTNTLLTQFVCGVSCSSSYTIQPRYSPYNYIQYFVNGNQTTASAFLYGQGSSSWYLPFHFYVGTGQYQSDRYFLMYPINYNNVDVYGTVNTFKITADSTAMPASNICRFIVSCPRISLSTSYGQDSGTTGTDLTATNEKLDSIISILSMIAQQKEQDDGTSESVDSIYNAGQSVENDINVGIDNGIQGLSDTSIDTTNPTSILGFVWRFLIAARLSGLFTVIALLAIVRWFIFSRGN